MLLYFYDFTSYCATTTVLQSVNHGQLSTNAFKVRMSTTSSLKHSSVDTMSMLYSSGEIISLRVHVTDVLPVF